MKYAIPFLLIVVVVLTSCGEAQTASGVQTNSEAQTGIGLLPEIDAFLGQHSEFGEPLAPQAMPDWANGKRQRVTFDTGRNLLFYTKGGQVVTIYEDQKDGGRVVVWGNTVEYSAPTPANKPAAESLPAYTVLFAMDNLAGDGRFGDALIPSVTRKTSASEREVLARAIAAKEGLTQVSFYTTQDAYEANISELFRQGHPDALREGFLGSLESNVFTPGETIFP